jgi:hypothetical protein
MLDGWWRWPLIPVASVAAGLAAAALVGLFFSGQALLMFGTTHGWWARFVGPVVAMSAFGWAATNAAYATAPAAKFGSTSIVAVVLAVLCGVLLAIAWASPTVTTAEAVCATVAYVCGLWTSLGVLLSLR